MMRATAPVRAPLPREAHIFDNDYLMDIQCIEQWICVFTQRRCVNYHFEMLPYAPHELIHSGTFRYEYVVYDPLYIDRDHVACGIHGLQGAGYRMQGRRAGEERKEYSDGKGAIRRW
jgi:hypothetical protein